MNKNIWKVQKLAMFALGFMLVSLLSSCLGSSTNPGLHYYVFFTTPLEPEAGSQMQTHDSVTTSRSVQNSGQGGARIGILPIVLPGYLQRPQVVVRNGDSVDMVVEDYHRWGEDLATGISRVLSINMLKALNQDRVVVSPVRMGTSVDYRLQVEIRRFEGAPNNEVKLVSLWTLSKDGKALQDGHFSMNAPTGPSIASMVEEQSRILEALGRSISEAILPELKKFSGK